MAKAIWNGTVLAESDRIEMVEGNHYFPLSSINREFFKESHHTTVCPWKGVANYFSIEVNGQKNKNAAWYYLSPKNAANNIRDHVAFWQGVKVES